MHPDCSRFMAVESAGMEAGTLLQTGSGRQRVCLMLARFMPALV